MREKWMMDFILNRLMIIHEFVIKKQYDIYEDISLLKIVLLATFPYIISTEWFASAMKQLYKYVDENGIYHFPKEFLTEKDSCWILGSHMGLGENRRKKNALEIEGTFRAILLFNKVEKVYDKEEQRI